MSEIYNKENAPKTNEEVAQKIKDIGLNPESVVNNRLTIKDIKEALNQFPDDMLVGFMYEDNKQVINKSDLPFMVDEGRLSYSGFDGHYSYNAITNETLPFLKIRMPDVPYENFNKLRESF